MLCHSYTVSNPLPKRIRELKYWNAVYHTVRVVFNFAVLSKY